MEVASAFEGGVLVERGILRAAQLLPERVGVAVGAVDAVVANEEARRVRQAGDVEAG